MVNKPVCGQLTGKLLLSMENPTPVEGTRGLGANGWSRWKRFDPQEAAAEPRAGLFHRVVRRAVIDQIDIDAVFDQVTNNLRDNVAFVESGNNGYDSKGSDISAA